MNYGSVNLKLLDWNSGDQCLNYPDVVADFHQVFIHLSVSSVSTSWRGLWRHSTLPPALITSPKTVRTHSGWSAECIGQKKFEGEKRIFICVISIYSEITERTKRYWFRGHGLKSNNTFLFIMFSVLRVLSHGRCSPSVFICQIKESKGEVYN